MGIRIAIGAIIAVLLGGTGYFAQQSHSTKNQLQKREIELSAEKDNTAKLNLRFKTIEQQMKGLQSRLDKEGTSTKTEIQEMSRQIAEKSASLDQEKAKVQNLDITLKQIQTTLDDERKARAEAEKTNQQNTELAGNRAEEIKRLETQAQKMSRQIAEKSASLDQEKAKVQNLEITLKQIQTTLDDERKARAETEKTYQQNTELAGNRAEEIKRLDTQAKQMSKLITEKNTDIKQERAEIRNLKTTHDITNSSLNNERRMRAEAEKANKESLELAAKRAEEIKRLEAQAKEMNQFIAEKNADTKQQKAEIRNLKTTHDITNSSLNNERRMRAEAEKANKESLELAAKRAEEIKRLEAQAKEMNQFIAEKNADIKQQKAEIRNLKTTHDITNSSLNNERRMRAEAEKANKESLELAAKRAEEIKRLEAQAKDMNQFIAAKITGIEQEKAKTRKLEIALSRIQASLKSDRKTQAFVDKLSKQNLEFAADRAKEIKRLEKVRGILETQVARMDGLIASEQKKAKDRDVTDKRNTTAKVGTEKAQNGELARKRAEEIARLEKTRMVLNTQVQEMSRLIAEKNTGIAREKTKTQNLELALNQIRGTLDAERKTRAKAEKANAQIAEFARNQTKKIESLAKAGELLRAQVQEMSRLIAEKTSGIEQQKAKTQNIENALKMRTEETDRLAKAKELLGAQVQEMSQLIAEKTSGIEQQKAKTQNIENALKMRTEETDRLAKAKELLGAQVQEMSQLIAEKTSGIEQQKAKTQNIENALKMRTEETDRLAKAKELLGAQVQEMSQLIAEKTSVAELIKNKLDQTNLSLSETIKKHTLAIARSKILEKKAREEAERAQKLESDLNELNKKLKKQFVSLQQTKDLLRVTFVNSLLFDSGSARLREKGLEALLSVAEFLQKQKDKVIRVEGHTDNQPIKGNLLDRYPSNWELSSARAVSIVKFLESNNISPARMSATGHSFYRPVASNDTGDGRAKNRRTDILLSNRTPKAAATTP